MSIYTLMHKNIPVVEVTIPEGSGTITEIHDVHQIKHLPIGVKIVNGNIWRQSLNSWWRNRRIPATRDGLRNLTEHPDFLDPDLLMEKCFGLSLSDQYWISPRDNPLNWSDINFFENEFSEDVGNILFGTLTEGELDLMSPDNTSDGWLKKKWKIINGKRCLIKAGSAPAWQEPYNEVIATMLMDRLGIYHTPYTLITQDNYPYSVCETFVTPNTELITAWYIGQSEKRPNHISVYQHYLTCCEKLGLSKIAIEIDKMIALDFIIANEDRHQNNFGVIRDVSTLEVLNVAPIYDSGSSLWFNHLTHEIGSVKRLGCKPFKNKHDDQIKLVRSFDWLDLSKLKGFNEEVGEFLKNAIYIDGQRRDEIIRALDIRINMLEQIINNSSNVYAVDNIKDDVKSNVAYSGKK